MNKKQFVILLGLVVVLGIVGITRWKGQSSSWSGGGTAVGQKLLANFDVNAVAQIQITHGTNQLLLAKKDDTWRVAQRNDYPANFSEISSLLLKLKDLKVIQSEAIGASQLPRLELAPSGTNSPTVVAFRDASGKDLQKLTLGKKHMKAMEPAPMADFGDNSWPDGRYVQTDSATDKVVLISDPLTDLETNPGRFLNKNFFKVEKPRTISVSFLEQTNTWKLVRETENGEFKLADAKAGEQLDGSKVSGVSYPFSSPSFNDVVINKTPEETGLDKPTTIEIETFDGFHYTVKVGSKQDDNYPLTVAVTATLPKERTPGADEKPEDKERLDKEFADKTRKLEEKLTTEKAFAGWTYLVSSWSVDSLLKPRSELLVAKGSEEAASSTEESNASGDDHEGHNHP